MNPSLAWVKDLKMLGELLRILRVTGWGRGSTPHCCQAHSTEGRTPSCNTYSHWCVWCAHRYHGRYVKARTESFHHRSIHSEGWTEVMGLSHCLCWWSHLSSPHFWQSVNTADIITSCYYWEVREGPAYSLSAATHSNWNPVARSSWQTLQVLTKPLGLGAHTSPK